MFNNLIESSSHHREFRRRGSFFLFTTLGYALLFVVAGVASIYAYDARMTDQNLELATIMPLLDVPQQPQVTPSERPASGDSRRQDHYVRRIAMAAVDDTRVETTKISTTPNTDRPMPPQGVVKFGDIESEPSEPGGGTAENDSNKSRRTTTSLVVIKDPPPDPQPEQKQIPKIIRKQVINGDALVLPKPPYPPIAKTMRVQGTVNVQVLIDERGTVISATPVSGPQLLVHAAKQAALQARFSPTLLGEQPVKVSGVITYNFVLQE